MTLSTTNVFTGWGLKTRIVTAFIVAWLIGCTCLAFCLYRVMLNQHHKSIRTRLHDYVSIAARTIDPEKHALLKTPEDEVSDTYKKIATDLRSIRNFISDHCCLINFPTVKFVEKQRVELMVV